MHGHVTARARGPRGLRLASPATARVVGLLVALLLAAFPLVLSLADQLVLGSFTPFAIYAPSAAVGYLIARRRPGNPIGWLLLIGVGGGVLGTDAGYYAWAVYGVGHRGLPLGWLAVLLGESWSLAILTAFPLVILLFPDGLAASRAWRRVVRGFVGLAAISVVCALVFAASALIGHRVNAHTVNDGSAGALLYGQPPATAWLLNVTKAFDVVAVVLIAVAVIRQVLGYRRLRGASREQSKWFMGGLTVCVLAACALASGTANGGATLLAQIWSQVPWVAFSALPISISVAILRYRLYEIDRLISRTLSYAILTALLVGTFIGIIALATDVLPFSGRVGVAASTLVAAALFNPLRVRIQRLVERRFNRARYDAEATVAAFSARLREAVELDTIRAELLEVVNRAVQPTHVSLWIRR